MAVASYYGLCFLSCRWEVIANYMNLHSSSGIKRTAKDVINKAKTLQKLGEFLLHFSLMLCLYQEQKNLI